MDDGEGAPKPTYNRVVLEDDEDTDDSIYPETLCIASGCMSWRWALYPDNNTPAAERHTRIVAANNSPLGYCGLAGKP